MVIESIDRHSKVYFNAYKNWISSKPQIIGDIESTVRCLSYFTAGRCSNSSLLSELIYSIPNLIILLNDHLICSERCKQSKFPQFQSSIKIWLTILEYTEALLEVSAKKLSGENGKWLTICIVQSLKTMMRLVLLYRNEERIIQNPAIPPINREILNNKHSQNDLPVEGFILKRSRTIVRSVNASGPIQSRIWTPLTTGVENSSTESENRVTKNKLLLAETLYVIKPVIHLTAFIINGKNHWLPWTIALVLDITSLQIFSHELKSVTLTKIEHKELYRRRLNLLLYLLRSPFYNNCSRTKVYLLLDSLSRNIPFAKLIVEPIVKYLPHWQKTYFYMWSC